MGLTALFCVAFGLATAASITLVGDRSLLGGKSWGPREILALLTDWRFVASMALAVAARGFFIATNVALLRNERLAPAATTVTAFVTASAYLFVVAANWLFLGETLTPRQMAGAAIIMAGILVMTR